MTIKITIPNTSSDTLTFGSANTPTAAQIAGIDSGSSNGQLAIYTTASGTSTERVRVDASGNVGIGYTSMSQKLQVNGNIALAANTGLLWDTNGSWQISSDDSTYIRFVTSGSEKMRIDSSGNLLIGTGGGSVPNGTSVYGSAFDDNGANTKRLRLASSVTTTIQLVSFYNPNGNVGNITTTASATAYATSSDYRLKNTIAPMTGALAKVQALKPVTYKWNVDNSDGQGFIAHELAEVVPQCVIGEKDAVDADGNPIYQGIDTSFLVATLTAAIQEQQALITALTARITALENK